MEATIKIDGKDVRFKSNAATPMLYRSEFGRDLFRDLQSIAKAMQDGQTGGGALPTQALLTFEHLAYIMAKQAEPDKVPDTPEAWLGGFPIMPFYAIMPMLLDLWSGNMEGLEESKKKAERLIESLQQLSSSCGRSGSGSLSGT